MPLFFVLPLQELKTPCVCAEAVAVLQAWKKESMSSWRCRKVVNYYLLVSCRQIFLVFLSFTKNLLIEFRIGMLVSCICGFIYLTGLSWCFCFSSGSVSPLPAAVQSQLAFYMEYCCFSSLIPADSQSEECVQLLLSEVSNSSPKTVLSNSYHLPDWGTSSLTFLGPYLLHLSWCKA